MRHLEMVAVVAAVCLPSCSRFGSHKPTLPDPTELIVTGAAIGSTVFVDGSPHGQEPSLDHHPQIIRVSPGSHTVEVHLRDATVYREETYVALGEHQVVTVLSGSTR